MVTKVDKDLALVKLFIRLMRECAISLSTQGTLLLQLRASMLKLASLWKILFSIIYCNINEFTFTLRDIYLCTKRVPLLILVCFGDIYDG